MNITSYRLRNRNWLSQFNLYKYESANEKRPERYPLGVFFTLGMILFMIFVVCLVVAQSTNIVNIPLEKYINLTDKSSNQDDFPVGEDSNVATRVDILTTQHSVRHKPLRPPKPHSTIEEKKIDHNLPENLPTNETEYLLEREDSQPINLKHSPEQKVKFHQPRNQWNEENGLTMPGIRDQIPRPPRSKKSSSRRHVSNEIGHPRPFDFLLDGPLPSQFRQNKKLPHVLKEHSKNVNSIQDILQRIRDTDEPDHESGNIAAIHITGRYRHPKGNGIAKLLSTAMNNKQPSHQESVVNQHVYGDPFHRYKPRSPNEINLLAGNQYHFVKQPSFHSLGSYRSAYQQSHTPNPENMYSRIMTASGHQKNYHNNSRSGKANGQSKPLSLMLDIYPMHEDHISGKHRPQKKKKKTHFPLPNAVNNLPYSFQLDNSYYNHMNFPQVQHNKFPQSSNFYHNTYLHSQHADYTHSPDEGKPSQIMVHLNLFPKQKDRSQNKNGVYDVMSPELDDRISDEREPHSASTKYDTGVNQSGNSYKDSNTTSWSREGRKRTFTNESNPNTIKAIKLDTSEVENAVNSTSLENNSNSNESSSVTNFKISNADVIKFEYNDGMGARNSNVY